MATKKKTTTTAPVVEEQPEKDAMLTTDQECNLFRQIIKCYNVIASYGAQRRMTIDRPFVDWFGVFGNAGQLITQPQIAPYWNDVALGKYQCPKDNAFVKTIMDTIDWDHI